MVVQEVVDCHQAMVVQEVVDCHQAMAVQEVQKSELIFLSNMAIYRYTTHHYAL